MAGRRRLTQIVKWLVVAAVLAVGVYYFVRAEFYDTDELPEGFAASNGRIEAVEIDVATKTAGRVIDILVDEGDFITAGQVLARMETDVLEAQLREAQAQLRQARSDIDAAQSRVTQRESERAAAQARVTQREAELEVARSTLSRTERLAQRGAITEQDVEEARAKYYSAQAVVNAAQADVAQADAAIATARSEVIRAEASVEAAQATIERIEADLEDSVLRAPRDGRVQYRVAQPGEVLSAGGIVLNMVDLTDVYMTFFLPTGQAGRVELGAEARVILDAAPQFVIPASISFVADVAQFTPKTVETEEERQKLMFRIRAQIDPDLLQRHIRSVKTGLPGMAYVQLDPQAEWPPDLEVNIPQ